MTNPIRFLYERLTERIFGLIASSIGNAVSVSRIACEAEQQSALEDLARKYEAEGKQQLADQLRTQAAAIQSLDPASDGAGVLNRLGCAASTPGLPSMDDSVPTSVKKPARKRRSRLSAPRPVEDGQDSSREGGL